jgi:beta-lactamase regulating signal transducer with metallopeptidase domain
VSLFLALLNSALVSVPIALVTGVGLRGKRFNAATRYMVWWVALAALVLLPLAYLPFDEKPLPPPKVIPSSAHSDVPTVLAQMRPVSSVAHTRVYWHGPTLPVPVPPRARLEWFAIAWAITSGLMMLRLGVAFLFMRRRQACAPAVPEWLAARASTWCPGRRVHVALSDDIQVPMATGPRRPTIVIPTAMLTVLSTGELEQVGLHEGAHLSRRDDYAILLQKVIEAVFVFHPVIRLICCQIELEREIACDDLVLAGGNGPNNYALCLTRVAELAAIARRPLVAATAIAGRSHLASRIAMLLDQSRNKGTRLLKVRLVVAMAGLAAVCWVSVRNPAAIAFAQSIPGIVAHLAAVAEATPEQSRVAAVQVPADAQQPYRGPFLGGGCFGTFPADEAAGKHVRFSGYIKTKDVTEGYAALWWSFDDMPDKSFAKTNGESGARGTTDWKRYQLEVDVPVGVKRITFGMVHRGNGTVWLDSLAVELDGKPYRGDGIFDFDFETVKNGFRFGGETDGVGLDSSVSHTGKQSVRLESGGPRTLPSFGNAIGTFPLSVAAGKKIRFSGYIKTENVTHGYAGLWWRVDGAERPALAFDNMENRGQKGTSDWTRYEINLPVSSEAKNINFGVLLDGDGTAWFDSLAVEVDGVRYAGTEDFDLDFESEWPRGFNTGGNGYGVQLDHEVFHTGKQSLRMRYGAPEVQYYSSNVPPNSGGSAAADFPPYAAVGKRVRVSGFIKTSQVTEHADLFWRTYGAGGLQSVQSLDIKPTGTTDWKRYEFETRVGHSVSQIQFGVSLVGGGTAWFDSLQIEVDGVPYRENPVFDLDFEALLPNLGFSTLGQGYRLTTDSDVFHTGKQSLRVEKTP